MGIVMLTVVLMIAIVEIVIGDEVLTGLVMQTQVRMVTITMEVVVMGVEMWDRMADIGGTRKENVVDGDLVEKLQPWRSLVALG